MVSKHQIQPPNGSRLDSCKSFWWAVDTRIRTRLTCGNVCEPLQASPQMLVAPRDASYLCYQSLVAYSYAFTEDDLHGGRGVG